jgi:hypothetical protein
MAVRGLSWAPVPEPLAKSCRRLLGSGERLGLDRVGEFSAELRPVFEGVPVAQHEIAVVTVNVGERTKPVVLHLKEPIGMVEGLRKARSGMGRSG